MVTDNVGHCSLGEQGTKRWSGHDKSGGLQSLVMAKKLKSMNVALQVEILLQRWVWVSSIYTVIQFKQHLCQNAIKLKSPVVQ